MAGVFLDPDAVRRLANELQRGAEGLAADLQQARALDISELTRHLGATVAWAEEQALALRAAADQAEALAHRRPAWASTALANCDLPSLSGKLTDHAHTALVAELRALIGEMRDRPPLERTRTVASWFAQLTPAEQAALTDRSPELIGQLDGIPFRVRDIANRIRYQRIRGQYLWVLESSDWWDDVIAGRRGLFAGGDTEHLAGAIRAIDMTLANPERYLLNLELEMGDQPKIVVAIGDPDTADHIAVYTPGFTTTVKDSLQRADGKLAELRMRAESLASANGEGRMGSVSTIFWLGYEAPQTGNVLNPADSVLFPFAAERGSVDLVSFWAGANAVRQEGVHLSALGHSYGSLTTGLALKRAPADVDDAVIFGSPGLGVSSGHDLHAPAGHVFVIESGEDVIADAASFGPDPNRMPGITSLSSQAHGISGGRGLSQSFGHSAYLTDGTTSQHNLAAIVLGLSDVLIEGIDRDLWDERRAVLERTGLPLVPQIRDYTIGNMGQPVDGREDQS